MRKLTALTNENKSKIANSGANELSVMVNIEDIKLDKDFENLFPLNESMVIKISEDIKLNGFDKSQPIHIWKKEMLLIDGHHRRLAAQNAGLKEVPVFFHNFETKGEALEYAILLQTNRRNLSDAEIFNTMQVLDCLKKTGKKESPDIEEKGKSAEITAKKIGVSRSKIEKSRTIENKATDEIKEAVASGDMSINKAYNLTVGKDVTKKQKSKILKLFKAAQNEKIFFIYSASKEAAIELLDSENSFDIADENEDSIFIEEVKDEIIIKGAK